MGQIFENGLMDSYIIKNLEAQTRPISKKSIPGVLKKDRFKRMPRESQKRFRKFYELRDGYAKKLDIPANDVVSNEQLFQLCQEEISHRQLRFSNQLDLLDKDTLYRGIKDAMIISPKIS
ncbi:MAG: hypothetical protein PF447_00395 [Spirochaetaceae bacterium]|jgi:ribonuclease D|nr:hypothetical protein [Spirochaetaceae bacterium]